MDNENNEQLISESTAKKFEVLIVDDSSFSRSYLQELLGKNGYKVIASIGSAQEAFQIIREKKPELVLCDVVMPEMSGIELAKRSLELDLGSLFIMISSLSHEQIILESISAGAIDYIQKPINEKQLFDSLEKAKAILAKK